MAKQKIYTFYAELKNYKPKIWRRFEIDSQKTMAELSYIIMIMFEMRAQHLFSLTQQVNFTLNGRPSKDTIRYEFFMEDNFFENEEDDVIEPDTQRLNTAIYWTNTTFLFEYDFGDGWEILLNLESIREEEISLTLLPRVLDGKGYGIVENIGGVSGLKDLSNALKKGSGKEYDFFVQWLDSTALDLQYFDKQDINFRLKKLLRVYRDIYEYQCEPTRASEKILYRDYLEKGSRGY